jgi:peptide/nickel transport system ATP-binding protein
MTEPSALLSVRGLTKRYPTPFSLAKRLTGRPRPFATAIQDIDLDLAPGEVLGLVGGSGSGKSTTAMTVMRLLEADAGRIVFRGADVTHSRGAALQSFRREAQLVFQDPYQSINPRFTVLQAVSEPLVVHGLARRAELRDRAVDALMRVGLPHAASLLDRLPAGLSGGQRQRVSIARAMILAPRLLVADEPVSMLDVSIRAGILKLLRRLAQEERLGVLYISHDIATVRYLCGRVAVMDHGRIVETGATDQVLFDPQHPYSRALVEAVPRARGPVRNRVLQRRVGDGVAARMPLNVAL